MKQDKTRRSGRTGQAAVECALALPVLLLLIINAVNFGTYLYAWISVANAARTGAQYATTAGVSLAGGGSPSAGTVQTMVVNDLKGLPNYTATQVCVSASNSATVSCNTGSAPSTAPPAADTAEGSPAITYIIGAVDVTYTYSPLIPIWNFATLPSSSVHRQARMRILQ